MKKIGEIMKEMGFNPDAPQSTKEAFVRNLIRSAYGVDVQTPTEKSPEPRQLKFDFSEGNSANNYSASLDKKQVS